MPLLSLQLSLIGAGVLTLLFLVVAWSSTENVPEHERRALTVRGKYRTLLNPGRHFVLPFISETHPIQKTQTIEVPRQEAITQDNTPVTSKVTVDITVVDAEKAFLSVDDHISSTVDKAEYFLRTTIGDLEMSVVIHNHSAISQRVRQRLTEATQEWGVRVERVEVREVNPPHDWSPNS